MKARVPLATIFYAVAVRRRIICTKSTLKTACATALIYQPDVILTDRRCYGIYLSMQALVAHLITVEFIAIPFCKKTY